MSHYRLRRQLRAQGSDSQEVTALLAVAERLGKVPVPHLSHEARQEIADQLGIRPQRYHLYNRVALAGGLAVTAFVVLTAWFSGPGSNLYGVKGLTNFFHAKSQSSTGQTMSDPSFPQAQHLQPLTPPQPVAPSQGTPAAPPATSQPPQHSITGEHPRHLPSKESSRGWNSQNQENSFNLYQYYRSLLPGVSGNQ